MQRMGEGGCEVSALGEEPHHRGKLYMGAAAIQLQVIMQEHTPHISQQLYLWHQLLAIFLCLLMRPNTFFLPFYFMKIFLFSFLVKLFFQYLFFGVAIQN